MAGPKRIKLSRARGWRLPENAKSVAYPTRWANPFRPAMRSREANVDAVGKYRAWFCDQPKLIAALPEIHGCDLGCWCPLDLPCHADVLLRLANADGAP